MGDHWKVLDFGGIEDTLRRADECWAADRRALAAARAELAALRAAPAPQSARLARLEAVAEGVRAVAKAFSVRGLPQLADKIAAEWRYIDTAAAINRLSDMMVSLDSPVCDKCGK